MAVCESGLMKEVSDCDHGPLDDDHVYKTTTICLVVSTR